MSPSLGVLCTCGGQMKLNVGRRFSTGADWMFYRCDRCKGVTISLPVPDDGILPRVGRQLTTTGGKDGNSE